MVDPTPPHPSSSPAAPTPVNQEMSRRSFLKFGWAAFAGFLATSAGATLRFIFPNILYEPPETFRAGKPEDFSTGVSTKWTKAQRVWIVRNDEGIYAIWARCTHLGCTPNWFQAENRFRCPCHGSNYTPQGDVIAGPAPKPMYRCSIRLLASGEILIDKSILENRPGLREKPQFFLALNGNALGTAKA